MSDYVENQEYSMQLAAPGDDPFAYDWTRLQEEVDGAVSSWFDDVTPASLQQDIDVDDDEWARTNDALDEGPWRDVFGWRLDSQGLEAQPGDQQRILHMCLKAAGYHSQKSHLDVNPDRSGLMPNDNISHSGTAADVDPGLVCDHPKCSSKVFKRKGDLTRHKKLHEQKRNFPCMAQGCKFRFTRNDKLIDHIRAGHEAEDLFACPLSKERWASPSCSMPFTRDVLPLHHHKHVKYENASSTDYDSLNRHRQCPLPRCNFRTRTSSSGLDRLRDHLLKDHDPKGRKMYASLLASRGYDHESANIVCPICTEGTAFNEHKEFGFHFPEMHCPNLTAVNSGPRSDPEINSAMRGITHRLWWFKDQRQRWGVITDEQRKHRRTILSLLPLFRDHPVWEDIEIIPYGKIFRIAPEL